MRMRYYCEKKDRKQQVEKIWLAAAPLGLLYAKYRNWRESSNERNKFWWNAYPNAVNVQCDEIETR